MDLKTQFLKALPKAYFIENQKNIIEEYLTEIKWLRKEENILTLEIPGEGNMNFVLRVVTNKRRFIIKQSRPFVQKYPQIKAPVERIHVEAQYIEAVKELIDIAGYSPQVLKFDSDNYILIVEDLGEGADYSFLYQKGQKIGTEELQELTNYLSRLHAAHSVEDFPLNMSMRALNHEHIFRFPFELNNGFDLDTIQEGLASLALSIKNDSDLKKRIYELGEIYLEPSRIGSLLHGDYYPGSWLKVTTGIKIIDPEFGFVGRAEFDLGVFIAHLTMANQDEETVHAILKSYTRPHGFDEGLLAGFAGTEILRRLIGVAQLPLPHELSEKEQLMQRAVEWIKTGQLTPVTEKS